MWRKALRWLACPVVSAATLAALLAGSPPALAQARGGPPAAAAVAGGPARARLADAARVLPPGWRTSRDRAVTVAGDASGLHVLTADAASGYAWRTVATLTVPGTDTSQWIGQACLTGSGTRAVVVYAPRQITNAPDALGSGALAAVVNLATGQVRQVGAGVSIAYFDPGCGTGQDAVLTQGGTGAGQPGTRLMMLNAISGQITATVAVPGQVTSAVPFGNQIAGVRGDAVVSIGARGRTRTLTAADGRAYRLAPDGHGGLGFLVAAGRQVQVRRWAVGRDRLVGSAALGSVELSQVGGQVFVTGERASRLRRLPRGWRALDVTAGSEVSSTGLLAVSLASTGLHAKGSSPLAAVPDLPRPVSITAQVTATGRTVGFKVPAAAPPRGPAVLRTLPGFPGASHRAWPSRRGPAADARSSSADPATTTYDPDRSCSVPRNDPTLQTYQPSAQQVQWAVDQAVQGKGELTKNQPANLYGSGLPSYSPQGWFPAPGLSGGGQVPAQVLLGILAQESNEDQASVHAIIGQTGNFEPSYNWYGDGGDYTFVKWADSDCGYGIAQITTGMCLAGYTGCTHPFPYQHQEAAAIDYEANIAAGLQILEQKWNQLHSLGIIANGGNPKYVENWWFALWAYNSGLEPDAANGNTTGCSPSPSCTDAQGNWGLGWVNNPANPIYPPDRPMFLEQGPKGTPYNYNYDASHPQYWSYEEKVIGFAAYGFLAYSYIDGVYEWAFDTTYYGTGQPPLAQPSISAFCSTATGTGDHCDPSKAGATGACQLGDLHCWWHSPVTWNGGCQDCGTQTLKYPAGSGDPGDPGVPRGYAPDCSSSPLPAGAVIVGDTASSIPQPYGCGQSWHNNGGTMTWKFAAASTSPPTYPSKIDFHQIGGGYGGHFWFTHTLPSSSADPGGPQPPQPSDADLQVTGTWTPPSSVTGWTRIMAAIPNEGAWDPEANYQVVAGSGKATQYRVINQAWQTDTWVDLGVYDLSAGAHVSLSNITYEGLGEDIAWDAVAFIRTSAPTADYAAMGDSYSSGEGLQPYDPDSDFSYLGMKNACHRSVSGAYPRMVAAKLGSGVDFHFTACSGAEATQLTLNAVDQPPTTYDNNGNTDWGEAQNLYGELPQADQGWLTPNTTLVTLTIGGNDARFSDVLAGCILTLSDCINPGYKLTRNSNGKVDPQPLIKFEPTVIGLLESHLLSVYRAIDALAPNAEIIVLGYPELFPASPPSSCLLGLGLSMNGADQAWLNQMGSLLDSTTKKAVSTVAAQGVNIHYIDPVPGFTGHEICSPNPWINGLVSWSKSGSGLKIPGAGSFHPTLAGQQEYARLVEGCLAGTVNC